MISSKLKNNYSSNKEIENIKNDVKQLIIKKKLKIHIPNTKIKLKKDGDYDVSEPEIRHREVEIYV
jgi:hypothetical protein